MVEGGAGLITSSSSAGYWDALTVFVAPLIIGEGLAAVGDLGVLSPKGDRPRGGLRRGGRGLRPNRGRRRESAAAEDEAECFTGLIEEVGELGSLRGRNGHAAGDCLPGLAAALGLGFVAVEAYA